MTLDHMLDLAHKQAERVLVGTSDELLPVFLFVDAEDKANIIATPFTGVGSKDAAAMAVRKIMAEHQAVAYSFLSEAWMATEQGENAKRPYDGPPPSERPDRVEVVMALASTTTESKSQMWKIIRGEGGLCVRLESMGVPGMDFGGRFSNLLSKPSN